MKSQFMVVFENEFVTEMVFGGSVAECKQYLSERSDQVAAGVLFMQEVEFA